MLIQLREGLRNSKILKYTFVGIITVPFALFGVGSYFTAGVDTDAAIVNGEEVSVQQFESALLQQQDRMRQMFGGKVPGGLLENPQMREGALEQLVQRQLMVQRVRDQNYTVSDAELAKAIRERDEFQVNGVFDQARYDQILAANRVSSAAFEETTRRDQGLVQLFGAVTGSAFVLPSEQSVAGELKRQEREFVFAVMDVAALGEALEIADEDVESYYKDHESSYMRAEQFKVSYIELDAASLGAEVEIDEAAIEAEYRARIEEFATAEQRDASHILLALAEDAEQAEVDAVMAKAAELVQSLAGGGDFSALAKEHSIDTGSAENGGSLGLFGKGAMVEAFEGAAFALAVGDVSEPVRSPFGVHIIKLNSVQESQATPLAELRDQLQQELVDKQVADGFFEKQDVLAAETFENGGSLQPAADALGTEVQQSEWFSAETPLGIGQYPQVRRAVLLDDVLEGALNSSVLEVAENHAIVVRLDDRKPEELKPLEEVRESVVAELRRQQAKALADEQAQALLAAVESGGDFTESAAAQGVEVADSAWTARDNPEQDRQLLKALFSLARSEQADAPVWRQVVDAAANPVVLGMKGVRLAEADAEAVDVAAADAAAQQLGSTTFQALQLGMREVADVSVNERAINPAVE